MPSIKKRYIIHFAQHLATCELNYHRLQRLMPNGPTNPSGIAEARAWHYLMGSLMGTPMDTPTEKQSSRELGLSIYLQERTRYTTTVTINLCFPRQNDTLWPKNYDRDHNKTNPLGLGGIFSLADPTIMDKMLSQGTPAYTVEVRLYHDAAVAEVIACQGHRRIQAYNEYPNRQMYQCDEKAQLNKFLGELLEFCLAQGRVTQNIPISA